MYEHEIKSIQVTKALAAAAGYTAHDVLSESASAGTAWTFSGAARKNGGGGIIIGGIIESESESVTPRLALFLYNATPTCVLNDNEANVQPIPADKAKYVGVIEFPALNIDDYGDDSFAEATPSSCLQLPKAFQCAAADTALYGVLVTRDDFTQTATDDMTITLIIEQY